MLQINRFISKHKSPAMLIIAGLFAWICSTLCTPLADAQRDIVCIVMAILWLGCAAAQLMRKRDLTPALLCASFLMGLVFILQLDHLFSWHDLAIYSSDFSGVNNPDGHLGYIAYLVENGRLPLAEDPRVDGYSIFYNPPLYHIVQALWMKLNLALGMDQAVAIENMQVVTLMCAFGCVLAARALVRELGLGERAQRVAVLAMGFQPALHILGATLNNDIAMVLCALWCVVFVVRWHRTRRMADILMIAVTLGSGMAVKLNCALLIPCIAVVFAVDFFMDLKRMKMYIGQFAAFLALSVPVAVIWPVYHMIAFQMPLQYVRLPAETINVSGYSLWERFGIPGWHAIRGLFYSGVRKVDHNFWMQTLKTGLFDELALFAEGTLMWYAAYLLLVGFAAFLLAALALFVRMLVRGKLGLMGLFLAAYGAILLFSYGNFFIQYPYICSANFRYIAPVLALCALGYAHAGQKNRLCEAAAAVFALGCAGVWGVYFLG